MLIEYTYGKVIFTLFIIICAIEDIRKQSIDTRIFVSMAILTIGGYLWMILTHKEIFLLRLGLGLSVGLIMMVVAIITKEQVGLGDAMYFIITGLVLACKNVLLFVGTVLLAALVSLVFCVTSIIKDKRVKNKSLPLLPIALPVGMAVMIFA